MLSCDEKAGLEQNLCRGTERDRTGDIRERERESERIRSGVREIRTLPQETQLNSSSPCMVKTPPKATVSPWE